MSDITPHSLAEQTLNRASAQFSPVAREQDPSVHTVVPKAAGKIIRAAKAQTCSALQHLQKKLLAAADKVRVNMDAAEYKSIVLWLIFLKYITGVLMRDTLLARLVSGQLRLPKAKVLMEETV
jgi:hypothetical protein